jgi:hypothetical protein
MTTENGGPAERGPRKKRLSKPALRAIAWVAGGAAFAAPWTALAVQPKPVEASPPPVQQVVIRRIIRHVYTQAPAKGQPKVRYVYAPAAPAAAPPAAKTSGSHP